MVPLFGHHAIRNFMASFCRATIDTSDACTLRRGHRTLGVRIDVAPKALS